MRDKGNPGYVYFGQHPRDNTIKIGQSQYPFHRCYSQRIQLIGILREHNWLKRSHEQMLHERFGHHRVEGEWFRDCAELRSFIFHSGAHSNLWCGMAQRKSA